MCGLAWPGLERAGWHGGMVTGQLVSISVVLNFLIERYFSHFFSGFSSYPFFHLFPFTQCSPLFFFHSFTFSSFFHFSLFFLPRSPFSFFVFSSFQFFLPFEFFPFFAVFFLSPSSLLFLTFSPCHLFLSPFSFPLSVSIFATFDFFFQHVLKQFPSFLFVHVFLPTVFLSLFLMFLFFSLFLPFSIFQSFSFVSQLFFRQFSPFSFSLPLLSWFSFFLRQKMFVAREAEFFSKRTSKFFWPQEMQKK